MTDTFKIKCQKVRAMFPDMSEFEVAQNTKDENFMKAVNAGKYIPKTMSQESIKSSYDFKKKSWE